MKPLARCSVAGLLAVAVLLGGGCAGDGRSPERAATPATVAAAAPPKPPTPWVTRAIPEARGTIRAGADGKREALRYRGWTTEDFGDFRTYAYDDARPEPPAARGPMPKIAGDPSIGRRLFLDRSRGPCTGCHLIRGDDVWPAGSVGPDLSTLGDRGLTDAHLFDMIYDPRHLFPSTTMPPWGTQRVFTPVEIVHMVAFLQTEKGPVPVEKDAERNPATRARPVGFGDNLDPTNNPAVLRAEAAEETWARKGPAGKACADCHAGGPAVAMRGVAARYPAYVPPQRRVMSIEDFLSVHGPATTGDELPGQSRENLDMTMLIKMASNGVPVALDLSSPETQAALTRGRQSFERRVGQRNHACADCHTTGKGADKFLGGRLLANVDVGLTRHFPTWRTSQGDVWDMRRRMQWCMTPLGMNMLAADAVEYAELELFLATFDQGKPMSVPGIRH
jgi:sulfur-oxidizing protein SoxA